MKRLLILSIAILPFFFSCDKDNVNDEPEGNDTVPAADTLIEPVYIDFYDYDKRPVPIRFDSLAKAYPNDRLWFEMSFVGGRLNIYVYRGVDTIVDSHPCLIKISAESLYVWGYVNKWKEIGYIMEDNNQFATLSFFSGLKSIECDFNLNVGDEYTFSPFYDRYEAMIVDSIVTRKMKNKSERRWFYLKGEYYSAVWIEGIGDVNSGYHKWPEGLVGDPGTDVLRYYEKGELVYDSLDGTLFVAK